jgi:ribonuclease HI
METLVIYTDGGSRGNPGEAGIGVVIYDEKKENILKEIGKYIGTETNNVAEYTALVVALKEACDMEAKRVKLFLDSELIVKQIKGEYRVKHEGLIPLYTKVVSLLKNFEYYEITHVRREYNKQADKLVNLAIDNKTM